MGDVAVDYGRKRTGFAVIVEGVVLPQEPLRQTTWSGISGRLAAMFAEFGPGTVVLGLPLSASGGETDLSGEVRELAGWLESEGFQVELLSEVRSTSEALELRPGDRRNGTTDSIAAAVLLRRYLNLP
jgi:putative Holliday junction resolvase